VWCDVGFSAIRGARECCDSALDLAGIARVYLPWLTAPQVSVHLYGKSAVREAARWARDSAGTGEIHWEDQYSTY
jgi:hypothetical protein